ncbi:D-glucuronyl C5-epimerase C-terminus [Salinibacillus kushneri]|uniref:D-glucuronyl C5-epimerase C-terminus n=1 Tax=Salinibacillus kushneri TaxID=237682 RepID=A0A1I0AGD4_9BACI|nr:D-glucuronyl C5-epimerase family protein [Salinibacillus kushneri]SES93233.1 D-glucuronyl C5-epimerase C-terminus [Salinibacillus kushneri]
MDSNKIKDIKVVMHDHLEGVGKQIGNEFYIPISLLEQGYEAEKEWREKDQQLHLHVTKARFSEISSYQSHGNYLHFDKNSVENWNVRYDYSGIPKTVYSFGEYYNPSTIAQYGLQHYSLYLKNNDAQSKNKFLNVAKWFLDKQDVRGGWAYSFDLPYFPSRNLEVKRPWYSSIGLGMAMSVLARASYLTKDEQYNSCALRATKLFRTPAPQGVLAKFENKFSFYEECPTNPPSYILNGFMYSLIGLYDVYKATGNRLCQRLYNQGIVTLKRMLPLYDLGNRTAYDLTHYTTDGGYPNVAKWGYHITHIHLLSALYSIENDQKMKTILLRWKDYLKGIRAK